MLDARRILEIRSLAGLLDQVNYYQLLQVQPSAPLSDIKRSFLERSRDFHPDLFFNAEDVSVRDGASAVYKRLTEAYAVLRTPDARERYDHQLHDDPRAVRLRGGASSGAGGGAGVSTASTQLQNPQARKFFQIGMNAYRQGDLAGAELNFKFALNYEEGNVVILEKIKEVKEKRAQSRR